MTKKKEDGKGTTHRNLTAHERAIKSPKVREAVSKLRSGWDGLSSLDRGQQLTKLTELNCSERGLAVELRKPPSTLRRYIALVTKSTIDSKAATGDAIAKKTKAQSATSTLEAARQSKSMFQKVGALNTLSHAKALQLNSKAQPAEGTASPVPIAPKAPSNAKSVLNRAGEPTELDFSKLSLHDQYLYTQGITTTEKRRQFDEDEKRRVRRLFGSASLMKRQGRPLPPEDVT